MPLHSYEGSCHCGNIRLRFESAKTPDALGLRTDTCSFCNKHHAMYISDPDGTVHIAVRDGRLLERYRFGTKTADFLICKTCGVFMAAVMEEGGPPCAVINVNALEARSEFLKNTLQVADFEGEALEDRLRRRRARWTPVASLNIDAG